MKAWMKWSRKGGALLAGLGLGAYSVMMGVYAVASTRPGVPSQPASPEEAAATLERLGVADAYPFENEFLATPHGRMHFAAAGSGEPLLFLHGNPTWSFLYRDVMRELAGSWRVIAPDLIGFGLSEKLEDPDQYSLAGHIEDVSHLIEALDLRGVTLVVQDWGGPVGLGAWLAHPERIRSLVVMNTYGFLPGIPGEAPAPELALRAARAPLMGEQLVQGLGVVQRLLLGASLDARDEEKERVIRAYLGVQGSWPERAGALAFPRWLPADRGDPAAELMAAARKRLTTEPPPLLLIWGMQDPLLGRSVLDEWRSVVPGAKVVELAGVGHLPPEEAPETVSNAIRGFLDAQAARADGDGLGPVSLSRPPADRTAFPGE